MLSKNLRDMQENDNLDLRKLVDLIFSNILFVGCTISVFVCVTFFYVITRTPIFQSNALVTVNRSNGTDFVTNMTGGMAIDKSPLSTEMLIIQSRNTLGTVVEKDHLDITVTPHTFPIIGTYFSNHYNRFHFTKDPAPPVLWLDQYSWGGGGVTISEAKFPPSLLEKKLTLEYLGNQNFSLSYENKVLSTGTVALPLTFTLPTGEQGHLTIGEIFARPGMRFDLIQQPKDLVIQDLKDNLTIKEAARGAELISFTLTGQNPFQITRSLNTVLDTAVLQSVRRKSNEATQTLEFLNRQLPVVKAALETAEKSLNDYRSKTGNIIINSEASRLMTQMANIEYGISQHSMIKAQLEQRYTPESFQISQENTTLQQLEEQKKILDQKLKSVPDIDQAAITLTREVQTQNAVYTSLLAHLQQFELLKAGTQGELTIIDTAFTPLEPINSRSWAILFGALLLGFIVSVGWLYTKRLFFQSIQDPDQIESDFNIPVLATLLHSKIHHQQLAQFEKKKIKFLKLLSDLDPHDQTVEGLRSLRTNLFFKMMNTQTQVITISGPTPGIGKSFCAANLAHILSELEKRVLLLDADTRRGDLHTFFNQKRSPGLCDLLAGKANLAEVIQNAPSSPYLDFISTGTIPQKHAELLLGPSLKELIDHLKKQYDFIVIDTPPVLAVTDATIVMQLSDIKLIVLASGKHDHREISMTLEKLERAGLQSDGVIFNIASNSGQSLYSYRYAYRYHYRHDHEKHKDSNKTSPIATKKEISLS